MAHPVNAFACEARTQMSPAPASHLRPYSVAIDGAGNTTVTGYFQGTVNLGGGTMTAAGDRDVFVVNLAP